MFAGVLYMLKQHNVLSHGLSQDGLRQNVMSKSVRSTSTSHDHLMLDIVSKVSRALYAEQHQVRAVRRALYFTRLLEAEDLVKGARCTRTSQNG